MIYIQSDKVKADLGYLYDRIKQSMVKGLPIKSKAISYYNELEKKVEKASKIVREELKIDNVNSYNQVATFLEKRYRGTNYFNKLLDDKGKISTSREVLESLADNDRDVQLLLRYRELYDEYKNLKSLMQRVINGMVYPEINVAKTNRILYSNPSISILKKELRYHVIGSRWGDNGVLFSVDIKNQEPLLIINLLDIKELKEIVVNGNDLYSDLFYKLYSRKCTEEERKAIKVSLISYFYGNSEEQIKKLCKTFDGSVLYNYLHSLKEVKKYRNFCYGLYKKGYTKMNTYFGNVVYTDDIGTKRYRALLNIGIQGTGVDILAILVRHFDLVVEEMEIQDYIDILYTLHDEIVIDVNKAYLESFGINNFREFLKENFEHKIDDWIEFNVEVDVHGL